MDNQGETGRDYDNNIGLGGNLVEEGNMMAEGEEMPGQSQSGQNQWEANESPEQKGSDHSFHMDKFFEKYHEDPKFTAKEKEISQKIDSILKSKTGKTINFIGYIFLANKILMLSTFTEYLFQRFDIVTLFLCFVIILIEIGIFSHKHIYKWLLVLLGSLLLDALVLLDISPVS
jgi:hypothetical protein